MVALDMDDLLEQMSVLAEQAGDWREHLPYAAAVGFLKDEGYQQRYGDHVDRCQYCQQLIGALHPGEDTMAKLLSTVAEISLGSEAWVDVADAVAEARWNLDSLRDVVLAQSHGESPGALRAWANAQQYLVHVSQSLDDPNGGALVPWTATVALSLDTQPNETSVERGRDQFGEILEDTVSLLLASRLRVALAGDLQTGGISERICNLGHQFGRRRVSARSRIYPVDVDELRFGVTEYCAWPVHISTPLEKVDIFEASFGKLGMIQWLTLQGESRPYSDFVEMGRHQPAADEWERGLTALRDTMIHDSLGQISMGGSTDIGHGSIPSLAQDALVSLRSQRPLYVLGGFGGCAQEIAAAMHLTEKQPTNYFNWPGFDEFSRYIGAKHLHNGLNDSENQTLAETTDVEEAVQLVGLGMGRVVSQWEKRS